MKPQKKREHVKGAWWYIAGFIAFFAWCAETGRDPGVFLIAPFALYVVVLLAVVAVALFLAILGK